MKIFFAYQKLFVLLQRVLRTNHQPMAYISPKQTDIYHVHLHYPHNGQTEFYFRNRTTMCEHLNSTLLGVCYQALTNYKLEQKRIYANRLCVIRIEPLI